jgi:hypothetical protein
VVRKAVAVIVVAAVEVAVIVAAAAEAVVTVAVAVVAETETGDPALVGQETDDTNFTCKIYSQIISSSCRSILFL